MNRLLCTPYDPVVLDAFPATVPQFTAWLESGELRVRVWCDGGFAGTRRNRTALFHGQVRDFTLHDDRLYVNFHRGFIVGKQLYHGPFGVPVDQFVFVG